MTFDYTSYFKRYEALVAVAEATFSRVRDLHTECVKCHATCDDCCYALFDLTFIEALYINHCFGKSHVGEARERILDAANRADRQIHRIKRHAVKAVEAGKSEAEVLTEMGTERVKCPLLTVERHCELYDHRPITCRIYGIPTRIGDQAHTCTLSEFKPGIAYPTVNLEAIQRNLHEISTALTRDLQSKFEGLGTLLVPLSMALLTDYNEEYLGLKKPDDDPAGDQES